VQSQVIQSIDAGKDTRWSSLGSPTVCDDGYVRIHNQTPSLRHLPLAVRCVAAREIAAISKLIPKEILWPVPDGSKQVDVKRRQRRPPLSISQK